MADAAELARPTVLQVVGPSTGGIRRHVAELVRQIESLGWRSVVAGPAGVMAGVGPQDLALSDGRGWSPAALLDVRSRLRDQVRRVDLVHAHGIKAAAVVASIRGRAPMVVTLHNDMVGTHTGLQARVRGLLQATLLRRADHVVFVSDAGARAHRGSTSGSRSSVIMSFSAVPVASSGRGVVRRRIGVADDAPLVAVVARLHPQKDLAMFLQALADVRRRLPDAVAVVAGDGPQRDELERLRDTLGLADGVRFLGATDAAADLMAAADLVAISSRWEAGPIAAVEAMQLGTPVVLTDTGAVAELAGPAAAARVVPVGDADAFAAAIVSLLVDADARNDVAARGRALAAAAFDPTVLVHRVDAVYRSLLDRRASRLARRTVTPSPISREGVRS